MRQTLIDIMKICNESSEYSRRMQKIHELAMIAVGLTQAQREERHVKAQMRCELYKQDRYDKKLSKGQYSKAHRERCETDSGEKHESCNKIYVKG